MDGTDFRNRVVLKVQKQHLKATEFGKTKENWKKISFKIPAFRACNPSNYKWLFPLLKDVGYLSLRLQKEKKFGQKIDIHPLFGLLLSSCKKLKSLALEPHWIRLGSGIFQGLETLQNLEQLEILQPNYYMWGQFWGPWDDMTLMNEYRMAEDFAELLYSVKVYKSYFTEKKTIYAPEDLDRLCENNMELPFLHHLVEQVVINNQQCLESHSFYDIHQRVTDQELMLEPDPHHEHNYHETPALKCLQVDATQLTARMSHAFYKNWPFLEYLNSRPPLEQLEISYPIYNKTTYFLRQHVEHAIDKHAGTLKTFKLQGGDIFRDFDWSILPFQLNLTEARFEDMRQLEKLEEGENNDWIRHALMHLPKTVRRIYLKGAEGLKVNKKLRIQDFFRFDPNVVEQLTIFNSGGSLGNDVAGFICKNFKMLRKLNVSDTKTDDTGFSGISELKGEYPHNVLLMDRSTGVTQKIFTWL